SRSLPVDDFALAGSPPDLSSACPKLATLTTLPLLLEEFQGDGARWSPAFRRRSAAFAGWSRDSSTGITSVMTVATTTGDCKRVTAMACVFFVLQKVRRTMSRLHRTPFETCRLDPIAACRACQTANTMWRYQRKMRPDHRGVRSNHEIPALFFVKAVGVARAGGAQVVPNNLVGEADGIERARPDRAGLLEHEGVLRPQPADEAARLQHFQQIGPKSAQEHRHLRARHAGDDAMEHAQADVVGVPGALEAQHDGAHAELCRLADRPEVFLQLGRCAEEQFSFEAEDPDPIADRVGRDALAHDALGRENQLCQVN